MKQQADKRRKETKEWKKEAKMMLSMKDLVFKERLAKRLLTSMKIYPVVNISQVVRASGGLESRRSETGRDG